MPEAGGKFGTAINIRTAAGEMIIMRDAWRNVNDQGFGERWPGKRPER